MPCSALDKGKEISSLDDEEAEKMPASSTSTVGGTYLSKGMVNRQ